MDEFKILSGQQMLEIDRLQQRQQKGWKSIPDAGEQMDFEQVEIRVMPGVYPPGLSAKLLLQHLPSPEGLRVLDLGTGTGAMALVMASRGAASVVGTDIAGAAAYNARQNVQKLKLETSVEIRSGHMFSCISGLERFDLILANLPGRNKAAGNEIEGAQWDTGFKAHRALFEEARGYLAPGGAIFLVMANYPDLPLVLELAGENGYRYEVIAKQAADAGDPRIYYLFQFIPENE